MHEKSSNACTCFPITKETLQKNMGASLIYKETWNFHKIHSIKLGVCILSVISSYTWAFTVICFDRMQH